MALAELVDNSIQAGANNIRVIVKEEIVNNQRAVPNVEKIAVYDDGEGMGDEILELCLAFAQGLD